ncbi:MAG: hypothetical protein F6J86_33215 [Symploca sp. SIO1B1]|nr:hypothetical protein [Symploca sp. SIO1B1]
MTNYKYVIHPAIGVARVGNHLTEFFLAPNEIGGLPIECDDNGNESGKEFTSFKDDKGMIKRQGQKFCVYQYNTTNGEYKKLVLGTANNDEEEVQSIKWTVHLANKKSVWYEFSEQEGNLLLGEDNSYTNQGVSPRNPDETGEDRNKLIIDPGAKEITGANESEEISGGHFPHPDNFPDQGDLQGKLFTTLGNLKTDAQGNLIVLGGHGDSWGLTDLAGYGGGNYWFDDTSDGSITCEITLIGEGSPVAEKPEAWVIVGPPDFAPEIVNISSWDDTAFDVAVRKLGLVPKLYTADSFNQDFQASYERDILPIINRISRYHWVANVQSMTAFSSNIFDFSDPSAANKEKRQEYFRYFRELEPQEVPTKGLPPYSAPSSQTTLFSSDKGNDPEEFTYTGIPLMPLNSASNSVSEVSIKKFLALTATQYFFLEQWSEGKFYTGDPPTGDPDNVVDKYPLSDKDRASIGNVVGLPQCPGIEVTWTTQNMNIYEKVDVFTGEHPLSQLQIKHTTDEKKLCTARDETDPKDPNYGNGGCEPGDLTKRMAVPWQADFYNCSIQLINYTDPGVNKVEGVPKRPTYYTYWWPPQAPWNVINGLNLLPAAEEPDSPDIVSREKVQRDSFDSEMAGLQMNFARGINSYSQMVNQGWASLAFIRNKNVKNDGSLAEYAQEFPYFVETERNYNDFQYKEVAYQEITGDDGDQDGVFVITSLHKPQKLKERQIGRIQKVQQALAEAKAKGLRMFQIAGQTEETPISDEYEASLQQAVEHIESFREIKVRRQSREIPRSGRRIRF